MGLPDANAFQTDHDGFAEHGEMLIPEYAGNKQPGAGHEHDPWQKPVVRPAVRGV